MPRANLSGALRYSYAPSLGYSEAAHAALVAAGDHDLFPVPGAARPRYGLRKPPGLVADGAAGLRYLAARET